MSKKPLAEWTTKDVDDLIGQEENDRLEFKGSLPTKDGKPDAWIRDQKAVGDYATSEIAAEVIAFANAAGGLLVLGIKESNGAPPRRAIGIDALPACKDLAKRIDQKLDALIDPRLPSISVQAIETDCASGVVAIHVPRSRRAPHGHKRDFRAYIRRGERCDPMIMGDIRDLLYLRERGARAVDARLLERKQAFERHCRNTLSDGWAFRVTIVPTERYALEIDQVKRQPFLPADRFQCDLGPSATGIEVPMVLGVGRPQPMLRGLRSKANSPSGRDSARLWDDGTVEYSIIENRDGDKKTIYAGWLLGILANALVGADQVRRLAADTEGELAMEVEFCIKGPNYSLAQLGSKDRAWDRDTARVTERSIALPTYSVGRIEEFDALVGRVLRDLYNAAGMPFYLGPTIYFPWKTVAPSG